MGFSAQVQQPQTGGGKSGSVPQVANQVDNSVNKPLQASFVPDQNIDQGYGDPLQNSHPSVGKGMSGGQATYTPTSGQQKMGSPNPYPNTIGQWDNASIQPMQRSGKGKGA